MNTAKKMIFETETASFENEPVVGLDEIVIDKPKIEWSEITLSKQRINEIILEAVCQFNRENQ